MELIFYPYKISKRTEYSKTYLYDLIEGKDITSLHPYLLNVIMYDYERLSSAFDEYFEIVDDTIIKTLDTFTKGDFTYLFIPEGIKSLGNGVFDKQKFKYISLPSTLKEIGGHCFTSCTELKYIDIPMSVETIGRGAFSGCTSLKKINLPNIDALDSWVLNDCQSLEEINLPNNLKYIGFGCFNWCISLKSVTLPDSITTMDEYAFNHCIDLEKIKLSKNLTAICEETFGDCFSLKEIEFPDKISFIGSGAFENTQKLSSITVPKNLSYIGWKSFSESGVDTLIFKHDLKELTGFSYRDTPSDLIENSNIKKIVIDGSVKVITPAAVRQNGIQITELEYLGSKNDFESFKLNNKKFFDCLPEIKNIIFTEKEPIVDERIMENGNYNLSI